MCGQVHWMVRTDSRLISLSPIIPTVPDGSAVARMEGSSGRVHIT